MRVCAGQLRSGCCTACHKIACAVASFFSCEQTGIAVERSLRHAFSDTVLICWCNEAVQVERTGL